MAVKFTVVLEVARLGSPNPAFTVVGVGFFLTGLSVIAKQRTTPI